ncbi:MAG: hypothetical protein WBA74_04905, partial [Cyclobacteriaceae bacterium]
MNKYITTLILFSLSFSCFGQTWRHLLLQGETDFKKIQKAFYDEWDGRVVERGSGYKQFKRWEDLMRTRLDANGQILNIADNYRLKKKLQTEKEIASKTGTPNNAWTSLGLQSWFNDNAGYNPGHGRINALYAPDDTDNTIYVGAPVGGLWRKTDQSEWELLTDGFTNVGITDIYVDPDDHDKIMILTGDAYGNVSKSIGILTSEDGGTTWNETGLKHAYNNGKYYYKMEVLPSDKNVIMVVGTPGILRSADGGSTWSAPLDLFTMTDLVIHPVEHNIMYASGSDSRMEFVYYRSTDYGVTWQELTANVPTTNAVGRSALAVSADKPDYVYILNVDGLGGYEGVYRSTDKGLSFEVMSASPNIIGSDPNQGGGQGIYDMAIAVNPENAEEVYVGGFNIYKSVNGGKNFDRITDWVYNNNDAPYV